MRAGILGGTFDPVHLGHLRTAEEMGQELELEKVYLIPSASPPHKMGLPVTPFHHRLAMVRLGIGNSSLLEVLEIEGKRIGPSYSIETLRELHRISSSNRSTDFFFILGVDAFLEIESWKCWESLFDYAHFVVVHRPGFALDEALGFLKKLGVDTTEFSHRDYFVLPSGKSLTFKTSTIIDISSTRIREMVAQGRSIRFLVPDKVNDYIYKEGLYKNYGYFQESETVS